MSRGSLLLASNSASRLRSRASSRLTVNEQAVARDEAGDVDVVVVHLPQVGVALGLVDEQLEAHDGHVVTHAGVLAPEQCPGGRVVGLVEHAAHEGDDDPRQVEHVVGERGAGGGVGGRGHDERPGSGASGSGLRAGLLASWRT